MSSDRTNSGAGVMRRAAVAMGATMVIVLLGTTTACEGRTRAGHPPRPEGKFPAAETGWILPGPALPPDARLGAAPNFVTIRTAGTHQPLIVHRVTWRPVLTAAVARIVPPGGQVFASVSAADDDRTFLATAVKDVVNHLAQITFYEIRLSGAGRPGRLIPLSFRLPAGIRASTPVLSPDGSSIAAAVGVGAKHGLVVISTATGRVREWTWHGPVPSLISWSGNRAVEFVTTVPAGRTNLRSRLYRLDTRSSGTSLGRARPLRGTLIRFGRLTSRSPWWVTQMTIAAGGRTAFLALSSGSEERTHQVLVSINAVTGKPLAVVGGPLIGWSHDGLFCGLLWTDGSGRHLLVSCARFGRVDDGRFAPIRLPRLAPYFPPGLGSPFAWGG